MTGLLIVARLVGARYPHQYVADPIRLGNVTDVTDATFATEVVQKSQDVVVVVDLWAEWCGPCKTLGPILEKVINETASRAVLVKVDIENEQCREIAAAFRVQSIPAVFALSGGKIVDQFTGALPENEVRAWLEKLLPAASETPVDAGDEASLREALAVDSGKIEILAALGTLLVDEGRFDEAIELLAPVATKLEAIAPLSRARLGLRVIVVDDKVDLLLDQLLDQALEIPESKATFLEILDALGSSDPRYVTYRRRLATRLY